MSVINGNSLVIYLLYVSVQTFVNFRDDDSYFFPFLTFAETSVNVINVVTCSFNVY